MNEFVFFEHNGWTVICKNIISQTVKRKYLQNLPEITQRVSNFQYNGLNICGKSVKAGESTWNLSEVLLTLKWNDVENGAWDESFKSFQRYYLIDRVHRGKAGLCRIQVWWVENSFNFVRHFLKTFCTHSCTLGTFVTWIRWNWTPACCQMLTLVVQWHLR